MRFLYFFLAAFALMATLAHAASLRVQVVDQAGAPVQDAIVYAVPVSGKPPATKPLPAVIDQIKRRFVPMVSAVQTGASVTFPNKDNIEHDVYSFSPAKRFELKLFAKDQARSVLFDRPGVIAIGCNIHDNMVAYIYVTDTLWTGRTDANGQVSFGDVPAQAVELSVWHPNLAAPANVVTKQISLGAANRVETVPVKFRPAALRNTGGY